MSTSDDPDSRARYILPLDRGNTRTIDRTGGTFLHTTRTNPAKMKKVPAFLDPAGFSSSRSHQRWKNQHDLRPDTAGAEEPRKAGARVSRRHRR